MGLNELLLPTRLPRQIIYAGDRSGDIFTMANKRIIQRRTINGLTPAELESGRWPSATGKLPPLDTGVLFNSSPYIYNFFEFDKLPWQKKVLRELVDWKLQKIFPENLESYDHQFFRLDKKRIFSILVKKSLLEQVESLFAVSRIPLIYIGNTTLEIVKRLAKLKHPPDFFAEIDDASCTLAFQNRRSPLYFRKIKIEAQLDMAAEISKTVQFVKNNYACQPSRYWLIDHRQEGSLEGIAAELAKENLFWQNETLAEKTPYIPGCR